METTTEKEHRVEEDPSFYDPALDMLTKFIQDTQCEDITSDICESEDDPDWCERNCNDKCEFSKACLMQWLRVKYKETERNN